MNHRDKYSKRMRTKVFRKNNRPCGSMQTMEQCPSLSANVKFEGWGVVCLFSFSPFL